MNTRTLSLSLLLLGSGFCSVASARPRSIQPGTQVCKPKPVSAALRNYLDQVEVAMKSFVAIGNDLESVQSRMRSRVGASDDAQLSKEAEDALSASLANDPAMLEVLGKIRKVARSFRNFNPVPRSAAKIDAKLVEFSLKTEHGLDLLQVSLAAPGNQEMEDKAFKQLDEAIDILPLAAQEILALKQSLEAQAVQKTYVRG